MRVGDIRDRLRGRKMSALRGKISPHHLVPRMEESEYRTYRAVHPFDERFGVETSGLIYDLPTGSQHDACNHGYFAVAPSIFRESLERLNIDHARFRFVDLGSGKGRALLLASDYPFREVLGVELSPELHRIARRNIARYLRSGTSAPVVSLRADAAEFCWPAGPLVVYMWNAFAQPVMERVLTNLRASFHEHPREMYLVYMHPELEYMFDCQRWLERLWSAEIAMSEEDYSAWAFPTHTEFCAAYRAVG
jgi:SAM-dependent methyltransferase